MTALQNPYCHTSMPEKLLVIHNTLYIKCSRPKVPGSPVVCSKHAFLAITTVDYTIICVVKDLSHGLSRLSQTDDGPLAAFQIAYVFF